MRTLTVILFFQTQKNNVSTLTVSGVSVVLAVESVAVPVEFGVVKSLLEATAYALFMIGLP